MKKRFVCIILILLVTFSFASCNVVGNTVPESETTTSENTSTNANSSSTSQSGAPMPEIITPDLGEKGYAEYLYTGHCFLFGDEAPHESLITSVAELNQLIELSKIPEKYEKFAENRKINEQLVRYSDKYFDENALIVIFRVASSSSLDYTVKNVEMDESAVNVTLQLWIPNVQLCDILQWGIIIECKKGDIDTLNVVTERKEQQKRVSGIGLHLCLTHDVSLETVNYDFTPEDFPELNFDFTVEEGMEEFRDAVKKALLEQATDDWSIELINIYTRVLVITLTVPDQENVLRAVELLNQRAEVKWVEPVYEYYYEMD